METPPLPLDRILEEEFADLERPTPTTRKELAKFIRSVLQEPGIMRPSAAEANGCLPTKQQSAGAIEDGAPTHND